MSANNNPNNEPLPPIPVPLLNDPRPAPDKEQVVSAFKTLDATRDFSSMRKSPCAKEAFMDGAAVGLGAGMIRSLQKGVGRSAANWAFAGFVVMTVGTWEYCHYRIRQRRELMSSGQMPVINTVDLDAAKTKAAIAARQRDV